MRVGSYELPQKWIISARKGVHQAADCIVLPCPMQFRNLYAEELQRSFSRRTESILTNSHDKLATAREIPALYVIFLGNDYDRREERALSVMPDKRAHAGERGANKHRGFTGKRNKVEEINT